MKTVKIIRNTNGDSRVAKSVPDFYEFTDANNLHRADVKAMMNALAEEIQLVGRSHDWTKTQEPYRSNFYRVL